MDTSNIYASPATSLASSRTLLSAVSHSHSTSSLADANLAAPIRVPKIHKECEKLEASIFRARFLFVFLVVVCVLLLLLYISVVCLLLVSLPELTTNSDAGASPSSSKQVGFLETGNGNRKRRLRRGLCMETKQIYAFINKWAPEDRESVRHLLTKNYSRFYEAGGSDYHCFDSLKWMVHVLGMIKATVQESLSDVEHKQTAFNHTASCCSLQDPQHFHACYTGNLPGGKNRTFGHFILDVSASYGGGDGESVLQWKRSASAVRNVSVTQAGFYYVYSRVTFKGTITHQLILSSRRGGPRQDQVLLTYKGQSQVSSLQGVFRLRPQDTLSVRATTKNLHTGRGHSSYFGYYLVHA